ncbi:S-adenosyl-L-homocysteine hydrolase [Platysternon megacephalum]|uniref:C-C motif chemokine n=1 Tax=Platysternon megacephalum TaxID=55544 RepID=A0A4D9DMV0_9SAUR|nr:S-adenosyl-L-homocysteine hydrolase [Platysternon megacephalum]
MTLRILLLAAALCSCKAQGSENQASDCCLSHKNHPIPLHLLSAYRIQSPETGCRISAIVFITKKNRNLCVPPNAQWALDLMEKLDRKKGQKRADRPGKQPRSKGAKQRKQRKPQH